ncbi:MAG: hypothetical protein ABIR28_05295, partial [Vicinamibacteria bacterium]
MIHLSKRRVLALGTALALGIAAFPYSTAQAQVAVGGARTITAAELKTWLTAIASDEFEGRNTFTEGLGLAASYIANELKS